MAGKSPLRARSRATTSALQATELSRLGEMWKQAQREAKEKERELARTRARLLREERRAGTGGGQGRRGSGGEVADTAVQDALAVRQQARDLELQLQEVQAENAELRANYDEALTKLGESLRVLEERAVSQATVTDSARELAAQVDALEGEKTAILNTSMANLRAYEEDAMEKDRALATARDAQAAAEDAVRTLRAQLDGTAEQLRLANEAAARHEAAAVAARQTAVAAKEELTDMGQVVLDTKGLRTQVRHLRADNARLVRLLATTKEYKAFANYTFAPDDTLPSGTTKGSYLGLIPAAGSKAEAEYLGGPAVSGSAAVGDDLAAGDRAAWRDIEAYERHYGVDDSQAVEAGREHELWVPSDALRLTIQFRRKHLAHLPTAVIRRFLQRLNGVWRRRYLKQMANAKAKYGETIADLRRQLNQRVPYREVLQASTIQRLHNQLDSVRMASGGGVVVADHVTGLATTARSLSRTSRMAADDGSVTRSPRRRTARAASASRKSRRRSGAAAVSVRPEVASAPWSDTLTFDFPASADGGGGHGNGWTRRMEAKAVMNHALQTVDALSHQVAKLREENAALRQPMEAGQMVSAAQAKEAEREAHRRGVSWFGSQAQRLLEAAADAILSQATALRKQLIDRKVAAAASGGDAGGQKGGGAEEYAATVDAIAAIEREVASLRTSTRQLLEASLDSASTSAKYARCTDSAGVGSAVVPSQQPMLATDTPGHRPPSPTEAASRASPESVRWAMFSGGRPKPALGSRLEGDADREEDVTGW